MSIRHSKPKAYGEIHYYGADRCFNTEEVKRWNQNKILCDEIVSFDCGVFEMYEIEGQEATLLPATAQIVAVIIRPDQTPSSLLRQKEFVFCGYDLVEEFSNISAITNCGAGFSSIPYAKLTDYGLLPTYKDALLTQCALLEEDPEDPHADCEIIEIWRKLL